MEPIARAALTLLMVTALLAGCAVEPPPKTSPDLLAAAAINPARSLDLMREQGERFAHVPFLDGNRVELLIDGPASFAALTCCSPPGGAAPK